MKTLNTVLFSQLVRTNSVLSLDLFRYSHENVDELEFRDDLSGWFLSVPHVDPLLGSVFCTMRGSIRVFKSLDSVASFLKDVGYIGPVSLHIR